MPSAKRYYHLDGPANGLSPSQLGRSNRKAKREYMIAWFNTYYEDPANQTPYNGREGGYQYIWGGPFSANDELFQEFGAIVDGALIMETAEELVNEDGIYDWAPSSAHPNMREAAGEALAEREFDDDERASKPARHSMEQRLAWIEETLNSGKPPNFSMPDVRPAAQDVLDRIDALERELGKLKPVHGGIGHNRPPGEIETPTDLIREVKEATTQLKTELVKAEPAAEEVLTATKALNAIVKWIGTKLNNFVDATVKSAGDAMGKLLVPFLLLGGAAAWSGITAMLAKITEFTAHWLELITFPF